MLEIDRMILQPKVKKELLFSMNILAWRAIGNALDVDVLKMAPEYKNFDNPFLALQDELDILISDFKKNQAIVLTSKDSHYKQIKINVNWKLITSLALIINQQANHSQNKTHLFPPLG